MNCQTYQDSHEPPLTDAQMCKLLNDSRPSVAESPIFEHRLAKLKDGRARASGAELQALQLATDDEADSYK